MGRAIKGMPLVKAERYLNDVIAHKQAIAFTRYNGGVGRHAQGHAVKAPGNQCRWPEAACRYFLVLLNNLKANGEAKGLAVKDLKIPVLRWPGGCFADEYHWMDGIGPRENRR